jgi:hypothetical protein
VGGCVGVVAEGGDDLAHEAVVALGVVGVPAGAAAYAVALEGL